jgi:hypothetical protein
VEIPGKNFKGEDKEVPGKDMWIAEEVIATV